jgi:hypothetical protein
MVQKLCALNMGVQYKICALAIGVRHKNSCTLDIGVWYKSCVHRILVCRACAKYWHCALWI